MDPITNISLKKHPMSLELIHIRLLHPCYSFIKEICRHQKLTGLPKQCHKNINESPCILCFMGKWQFPSKVQLLKPLAFDQESFSTWNVPSIIWTSSEAFPPCSIFVCKYKNDLDIPYCIQTSPRQNYSIRPHNI